VKEFKTRVPLRVETRKNLPRFGDAKLGEENVTLSSRDFVSIEHPDDSINEDADDPTLAKTLANFISKQQERGMARDHDLDNVFEESERAADGEAGPKTDRYVAPGARGGAAVSSAGDFGFGGKDKEGTENTLRVSNLTKAVTEEDLRDLFERFGRIHRVSLPRIEKDGVKEPRGFAYIAFARNEDAAKALEQLQGHGYDHLILKLEWAKPNKGDGGAPSSNYMSGYGKALVQDTKEKVYYASNLTGNS
jgi:translation initiation factor 3 subunit G